MEVGGHSYNPAVLPPGKRPSAHCTGGCGGQSKQIQKILPPLELDPWTIQPIASCYTNFANPAHIYLLNYHKYSQYVSC